MKKMITILGGMLVVLIIGMLLGRQYIVDTAIRHQAERLGNRFHHEWLHDGNMHVVTVGTGSPIPNPRRAQSSVAVIADGVFVLFDVGAGAAQQADILGLPLSDLNAIFLTHLHSDHIADVPLAATKGWRYGRTGQLQIYGPIGTAETIDGLNQAHRFDREYRYKNIRGFSGPLSVAAPIARDIQTPGPSEKKLARQFSNGLQVYCFVVAHAPVEPAFGYRIEYKDKTVVISGDTRACENVARQAHGADLLIHEAFNKNLVNKMLALTTPGPGVEVNKSTRMLRSLGKKVQNYHTSPVDAAKIASRAHVKKLVFTHIDPPLGPLLPRRLVTQPFFLDGVSDVYNGEVIIAEDGMHFEFD